MSGIRTLLIIMLIFFSSCSPKQITEQEFTIIWDEYIQSEFVENFDEKQSIDQRKQIMRKIVKKYRLNYEKFKLYMKKNHSDKYSKVFKK